MQYIFIAIALLLILESCLIYKATFTEKILWDDDEIAVLKSLHIENLQETPLSNNNALAKFGQILFFENELSSNKNVSCASCHEPEHYFTDKEPLPTNGVGAANIHTPTIVGISNSSWFFWDGRKDSLWSQALGPLENPMEHGTNRMQVVKTVLRKYDTVYRSQFGNIPDLSNNNHFPNNASPLGNNTTWKKNWKSMREDDKVLVNQVFANIGRSIAEYEKYIQPGKSAFDEFVSDLGHSNTSNKLSPEAQYGVKLFLNSEKTGCINCHNGPLFSNHSFQATGISANEDSPDKIKGGRLSGIANAISDEFNCYSQYAQEDCSELKYAKKSGTELVSAFKVPTLRNVGETAPYMHNGSLESLKDVLSYYNKARPKIGVHMELRALRLFPHQLKQIHAFLQTLTAPLASDRQWLTNPQNSHP